MIVELNAYKSVISYKNKKLTFGQLKTFFDEHLCKDVDFETHTSTLYMSDSEYGILVDGINGQYTIDVDPDRLTTPSALLDLLDENPHQNYAFSDIKDLEVTFADLSIIPDDLSQGMNLPSNLGEYADDAISKTLEYRLSVGVFEISRFSFYSSIQGMEKSLKNDFVTYLGK